jgi:hypothetical protein
VYFCVLCLIGLPLPPIRSSIIIIIIIMWSGHVVCVVEKRDEYSFGCETNNSNVGGGGGVYGKVMLKCILEKQNGLRHRPELWTDNRRSVSVQISVRH